MFKYIIYSNYQIIYISSPAYKTKEEVYNSMYEHLDALEKIYQMDLQFDIKECN